VIKGAINIEKGMFLYKQYAPIDLGFSDKTFFSGISKLDFFGLDQ